MFRSRLSMVTSVLLLFAAVYMAGVARGASEQVESELIVTRTLADGAPGGTTVLQGTSTNFSLSAPIRTDPAAVQFAGAGESGTDYLIYFGVPLNGPLKAGKYEQTQLYYYTSKRDRRRPTLAVRNGGWYNAVTGSFEIKKVIYGTSGIVSLWMTFTQTLSSGERLDGELRYHIDSTATPVPQPFVVDAGDDVRIPLKSSIQLKGMTADDGINIPSCSWRVVSTPAGDVYGGTSTKVTFSDTSALEPTVTFSEAGPYTLSLTTQSFRLDTVEIYVYDEAAPWLSITSSPSDANNGINLVSPASNSSFTLNHSGGPIQCEITKGWERWVVQMNAPADAPFHVGTYPIIAGDLTVPRITVTGPYATAAATFRALSGTLEIKRVVYGSSGKVAALWAVFSVVLENQWEVSGEIRAWPETTLAGVNQNPRVTVGADRRVAIGSPVQLTAVADDDDLPVAGRAPTVRWKVVSGPEAVTIAEPDALQTSVTFGEVGDYRLACTASDGELSYTDELLVQVRDMSQDSSVRMHASWEDYYGDEMDYDLSVQEGDLSITADTGNGLEVRWQREWGKWWIFTFQAPEGHALGVGEYANAESSEHQTDPSRPAFKIYTLMGEPVYTGGVFNIRELVRDAEGKVVRFAAFFEGRCIRNLTSYMVEPNSRVTRGTMCGELRYFSGTVPNQPPTVESTPAQLGTLIDAIALPEKAVDHDGIPEFGAPRYLWEKVSGPGEVEFARGASSTFAYFYQPGRYVLAVTASDGVFKSTPQTVEVFVVAAKSGFFSGRVTSHDTATGFFNLSLTESGAFTASTLVNGETVRFAGAFGLDGTWSGYQTLHGGGRMKITLQIQDDGRVEGTIDDGFATYETAIDRWPYSVPLQRNRKAAQSFTVALRADPMNPDTPRGTGIGVAKLSPSGAVRLSGILPDGTSFSVGSKMGPDDSFSFHRLLYRGKGAISGLIRSSATGENGRLLGGVEWQRAVKGSLWGADGWHTVLEFYGNGVKPRQYWEVFMPGASYSKADIYLKATDGNGADFTKRLRQRLELKLIVAEPGPDRLQVRVTSGLIISGKWKDPATREPRSFVGILDQSAGRVEGFFLGKTDSGKITIDPPP